MNFNNSNFYDPQQASNGMMRNPNFVHNSNLRNSATVRTPVEQASPESLLQNLNMSFPSSQPTNASMLPTAVTNTIYPPYNRETTYYHEFWRMYLQNEVQIAQMKKVSEQNRETQAHISALENICQELEASLLNNYKKESKKKSRRTANEIEKSFLCPYSDCNKTYGSDVSLNLHIKIKHNGGNKTEREKLARAVVWAQMNGEGKPEVNLNLPPGFLENVNSSNSKITKEGAKQSEKLKKKKNNIQIQTENSKSQGSNRDEPLSMPSTAILIERRN